MFCISRLYDKQKMKEKTSLIKYIKHRGILFLIIVTAIILIFDVFDSYNNFKIRAEKIRKEYITQQKQMIKQEVNRVVNLINFGHSNIEQRTRSIIKEQVYEAYSIVRNIYQQNKNSKSDTEIQKLIIDVLRPIRFADGLGYIFITRLDGVEILVTEKSGMKNSSMLNVRKDEKHAVEDMIKIVKHSVEGFYDHPGAQTDTTENDQKKLSFIKLFKPYDWIIGTGLYVDDITAQFYESIANYATKHRFGKYNRGYVFILKLLDINGGEKFATMYANPNRPDLIGKYISDSYKDAKGKEFRKEFLKGLREQGECFVEYWYKKFDNKEPSPKISYFKLTGDGKFIVAAGVYLDDVEKDIALMKNELVKHITGRLINTMSIFVGIVIFFLILLAKFSKRFRNDFDLFVSFFRNAVRSNITIDLNKLKFKEFDQMARNANKMLRDKIEAQQELERSEKKYKELSHLKNWILESARGVIVYALDRNYCYIDFTLLHKEMMEKFRGVTIEIGGNKLSYIKDEKERIKRKKSFDRALNGESFVFYEEYTDEESNKTWFENRFSPIFNEDNQIIGLAAYIIDITELKRTEDELEENIERFEKLSSLTFEGILIHKNGIVLDVNESLVQMVGYTKGELVGKNIIELLVPKKYYPKIRKEMGKNTAKPYEIMGVKKDGTLFPVEIESKNVRSKNEDFRVTAIRDITERKKLEKERIKFSKLKSLGVLAGGIAHDFNNILTGLFGNLELAKLDIPSDHEAFKYLERAHDAIERATRLTKQLLTFSKGGEPIFETVDLISTVQEVAEFTLSGSNVKSHFNLPDNLKQVKADKGQISQVITNLTINAKQAMPDGGNLFIEAENVENPKKITGLSPSFDYVRLSIKDEGIGIPSASLGKIFDPFFTTKPDGSGLGLSTVYSIIEKHGGKIDVESGDDVGTVFTIYLPVEKKCSTAGELKDRNDFSEVRESKSGHILVMDDEELVRNVSGAMLKSMGYDVEFALNGKEAIKKYVFAIENGKPYDMVIMDLTIPGGMGGKETVKEILIIDSDARVIVSSGYSTDPILANYREYGFKGRLIKPFRLEDLKNELTMVMDMD